MINGTLILSQTCSRNPMEQYNGLVIIRMHGLPQEHEEGT